MKFVKKKEKIMNKVGQQVLIKLVKISMVVIKVRLLRSIFFCF